jgi:hypothetical protein
MGGTFTYALCLGHLTRLGDEETCDFSSLRPRTIALTSKFFEPSVSHQQTKPIQSQYHDKCNACHPGGDTRCFKLHPELKTNKKICLIREASNNLLTALSRGIAIHWRLTREGLAKALLISTLLKIIPTVLLQSPIATTIISSGTMSLATLQRQQISSMT